MSPVSLGAQYRNLKDRWHARPRRARITFWLSVLLIVVTSVHLYYCGGETTLVKGSERVPIGQGGAVRDLWFEGDDLIVVLEKETKIFLHKWSGSASLSSESRPTAAAWVDLAESASEDTSLLAAALGSGKVPLAIAPNADQVDEFVIAWAWKNKLNIQVRRLEDPQAAQGLVTIPLPDDEDAVRELIVSSSGTGAALFESGYLQGFTFQSPGWSNYRIPFSKDERWKFWPYRMSGESLVVFSIRDAYRFQPAPISERVTDISSMLLNGLGDINVDRSSLADVATAFAISPQGNVVVGTENGRLWRWQRGHSDEKKMDYLTTGSAIKAITGHGGYFAVGGAFSGIYLTKTSDFQWKRSLLDAPSDIGLLAMSGTRLAYASPESAEVLELETQWDLKGGGNLVLTLFSIAVSLVALFYALLIDKN